MRRLFKEARFAKEEHEEIARHLYAIEWHVHQILHLGRNVFLAPAIDLLLKSVNGRFGSPLRSELDNDFCRSNQLPSPYFGQNLHAKKQCPAPDGEAVV